jgi:hypothetical protein
MALKARGDRELVERELVIEVPLERRVYQVESHGSSELNAVGPVTDAASIALNIVPERDMAVPE